MTYWWLHRLGPTNDPDAAARLVVPRGELAADEKSTVELFKSASPSVVHITTLQADRFSFDAEGVPAGTGSGFVWDDQGHVVTNAHVLQNASAAKVTLSDGTTYNARLTGIAPDFDLAVLKIDTAGKRLPAIVVGASRDLQVGQKVFAIGNPFGLDQTLTTGVISALGRRIKSLTNQLIDDVVQTDAAINPGNSGGPLLDSAGRLIGVNTQIVSPSGAYAGIGFAIPVDTVNRIVPELIRNGRIVRPVLGVELANEGNARQWGVQSGVLVLSVVRGGPAEKAGILPLRRLAGGRLLGDIIVAIDDSEVKNQADYFQILSKKKVGESVRLKVRRAKEILEVDVVLAAG
ncbi:MAG: trypsin-like peptidase domain-containing protein [Gemmataceae bacterium]|nr:trypsin-like peptidase domain-containing protein [Gemmataceae bacterium]